MNDEEIRSTIEQMKAQIKAKPENKEKSDDEIEEMMLDAFFKSYTEGEMSKEDLLGIAEAMGYGPTDEFENDENAPMNVEAEAGDEEGISQEDLEETRTIDEGESAEEFKDKIEDVKEGKDVEADEDEGEDEVEDEDEERKKASELWKIDLTNKD